MPPISQFPAQHGYPSIAGECHSGNRRDRLSKRLIYVIIKPVAALQTHGQESTDSPRNKL